LIAAALGFAFAVALLAQLTKVFLALLADRAVKAEKKRLK
jgi:hypothetical protein